MMMHGRVNSKYEAMLPLTLIAADGSERTFTALVDTGCSAEVIVSSAEVALLGLPFKNVMDVTQADDEVVLAYIYQGEALWQGSRRPVDVVCLGKSVLIGMRLMRTHRLNIDVNVGGKVEVD